MLLRISVSRGLKLLEFPSLAIRHRNPSLAMGSLMNTACHVKRFSLASLPTVLIPPVVFTGLLLSLWTYKCTMMIAFQNKIIYMPFVPPFSRSERIEDYANLCRPVQWQNHQIRSLDGTRLTLAVGHIKTNPNLEINKTCTSRVIIVYFQG